jgi:hypothetical protein
MEGPGERRRTKAISPLVTRIAMVGTVAIMFVLLYALVSGLRGPAPAAPTFTVTITGDGKNWSVMFLDVPGGRLSSDTYLLIRNASGGIVLPRTSFAALNGANWSAHRAVYVDANPGVLEVRRGDGLRIDEVVYRALSRIEISDRGALLLMKTLQ